LQLLHQLLQPLPLSMLTSFKFVSTFSCRILSLAGLAKGLGKSSTSLGSLRDSLFKILQLLSLGVVDQAHLTVHRLHVSQRHGVLSYFQIFECTSSTASHSTVSTGVFIATASSRSCSRSGV
jgi:hypothetical protein